MSVWSKHRILGKHLALAISLWLLVVLAASCSPSLAPLPLTTEQRLEDFRYLSEILVDGYPYLEVSKRMTGYDLAAHIPKFEAEIGAASSDEEFAKATTRVLRLLNNGHTGIMSGSAISRYSLFMKAWSSQAGKTTGERADYWYDLSGAPAGQPGFPRTAIHAVYAVGQYVVVGTAPDANLSSIVPPGSVVTAVDGTPVNECVRELLGETYLRYDPLRKTLYQPMLTAFGASGPHVSTGSSGYDTVVVTIRSREGELVDVTAPRKVNAWDSHYSWPPRYLPSQDSVTSASGNLYVTMLEGSVAYAQIQSMRQDSGEIKSDVATLRQFMEAHNPGALVLDIRGNGGGSDNYWQAMVAMLASGTVSCASGVTWRNSPFIQPFMADKRADALPTAPMSDLLAAQATGGDRLPPEILTHAFAEPRVWIRKAEPDNSINYQGKVFLLVDGYVYSSAESFAAFCKGSKWATVVGSYTGGDGIGYDPAIVVLPNSGMAIRFPSDMGLNPDWSANEEFHTRPDMLAEWAPDDILGYAATSGRPARPDPAWDPQLRAALSFGNVSPNEALSLEAKIEAGLSDPDPLLHQAWSMIHGDIERNEETSRQIFADKGTRFTDAEITTLALTDSFDSIHEDAVIEVYLLQYRMLPEDMSKIMLAGGMKARDGWLLSVGSMGNPHLVAEDVDGEIAYVGTIHPEGEGQGVLDATLELLYRLGAQDSASVATSPIEINRVYAVPNPDLTPREAAELLTGGVVHAIAR
ncbi:MAG: S41 family peptidase [Bacillota bacterium]